MVAILSWYIAKLHLLFVTTKYLLANVIENNIKDSLFLRFPMKSILVSIILCIFADGFGLCHFQDIVGKQKASLLFRVQPKASETYWK